MTGRSRDEVDEALHSHPLKSFALNASAKVWGRHGASHPLGDDFTGAQDIIPQTLDEQTVLSFTADVPTSLLRELILAGTPGDVVDQVAEWRDCGLQYPVISSVSGLQRSLGRGLAASVLLTRVLRGLRKL